MASLLIPQINSASIQCAFLLILCIGVSSITEISADGNLREALGKSVGNPQREFDYYKLALQWPGTYCRRTRRCCSSNGCCRGSNAPAEFTIHGLWPDYNDGSWPSCCAGKKFDAKEVSTLLGDLNTYWPSLSCNSISNCHGGKGLFWEHEWEKHGTCSASVTGDEYSYFVTTLNMYFKYNVTEVLRDAGYVASNSEKYPLGGIVTAIENAFHTTPQIECSGDAVEELYLCFYKDFKPRDCAVKSNTGRVSAKKCPQYVSLPEYVSKKISNIGAEVSQYTLDSSF